MFFHQDIKGMSLPFGSVVLTFDDGPGETNAPGPGPRTAELGEFLRRENITATFFVLGKHAECHRDVVRALHLQGHEIGNHTYSHPGLVRLASERGDVVDELLRTEEILAEFRSTVPVPFRAPYGNWREKSGDGTDVPTSIVADILNRCERLRHLIGPVNWDVSSLDWEFWERGDSAQQCASEFLRKIVAARRGILLMHDSSENERTRNANRTFETVQLLVPALRTRGFRFVPLQTVLDHARTNPNLTSIADRPISSKRLG